jgi:endonuclease-8
MPEGPEIKRVAMRIGKVLNNRTAHSVTFSQPHLQRFNATFAGETVLDVSSRGKALLTHFSNDLTIYSHNQLYGRWYVVKRDKPPATGRTLRLAIHTETHSALLYSASEIEVLTPEMLSLQSYLSKLGPDALDEDVCWRDVLRQLLSKKFYRRSLAALYLDQSFVAGIGNYLRSEILHSVGLNPFDRPCDLTRRQLGSLSRATLDLTRQSLATAGVTNNVKRVARLKKAGFKRSQYRFTIFDRQGLGCYRCKTPVERIEVGSRRLYLCCKCQPQTKSE